MIRSLGVLIVVSCCSQLAWSGEVEGLAERLGSEPTARARESAALALADLGPRAKGAVPALVSALRDESDLVVQAAMVALRDVGVANAEVVEALLNAALMADGRLRSIGWDALLALAGWDAVLATLDVDDPRLTRADLGRVVSETRARSQPLVLAALRSDDPQRRVDAAWALSCIRERCVPVGRAPRLPRDLDAEAFTAAGEGPPARGGAIHSPFEDEFLELRWAPDPEVAELLGRMLRTGDPDQIREASSTIYHFGRHGQPAWPAAVTLLTGPHAEHGLYALWVACQLQPGRLYSLAPRLTTIASGHTDVEARVSAVRLLGALPTAAVTDQLKRWTADPEPRVSALAAKLLAER